MQTFKQFLKEQEIDPKNGCIGPDGVPCLYTNWDRAIGPDGVPTALIDWSDARARKRRVQEGKHGDHIDHWTEHHDNDHIGGSVRAVHEHLADADSSGRGDVEAVRHYTRDSKWLNEGLYDAHKTGAKVPYELGGHSVLALDKAMKKNKLAKPLNVYSGVRVNPGKLAEQHPEGHLHLPAFVSTSIDKDEARTFAEHGYGSYGKDQHIIHFHVPAGHEGKYVDHHSANSGEREFILPRGTTWKIHPKPDSYENNDGETHTHIWHAHPTNV
jgi:hypothetical protein